MSSARAALQAATRHSHERLHHLPGFAALAAGTLDLAGYRALLARLYGFRAAAEPAILGALAGRSSGLDAAGRQRAHLLRADLLALGMSAGEIGGLPLAPGWKCSIGPEQAMGGLYVLEGSRLGGRVLGRNVPAGAEQAANFFRHEADRLAADWHALVAALDRWGSVSGALPRMIAGAEEAFRMFGLWFEL